MHHMPAPAALVQGPGAAVWKLERSWLPLALALLKLGVALAGYQSAPDEVTIRAVHVPELAGVDVMQQS